MSVKSMEDLFVETLKDIYYAEKQILKALPKMARAAESKELREAFEKHRDQTEEQIARLERVFELIDKRAQGKSCEAIVGIIDESKEIMEEFSNSPALDAGLIASGQAVEHYEISRYGTLRAWAQQLGLKEGAALLEETLQEEIDTDELLSDIAQRTANAVAEGGAARTSGSAGRGQRAAQA